MSETIEEYLIMFRVLEDGIIRLNKSIITAANGCPISLFMIASRSVPMQKAMAIFITDNFIENIFLIEWLITTYRFLESR